MAISRRCPKCRHDNKPKYHKCQRCSFPLSQANFQVKIKDKQSGKWKTQTCPNLTTAKQVETKFKVMGIEGTLLDIKPVDKPVSFKKYLESEKHRIRSWKTDLSRWKRNVVDDCPPTSAQGIRSLIGKVGGAPATKHHVLKLISRVYNWAISEKLWHGENPCNQVKAPRYDNKATDYLSKDEVKKFIRFLQKHENKRMALVVLFALYTGRRKSEILSLRWSDVSLETNNYTCYTKPGKVLGFPLSESARNVVLEAQALKVCDFVFPCSTGKRYYSFDSTWVRLRRQLMSKGIFEGHHSFHSLRHTYASHLASSGKVDIYTLSVLLGHSDVKLTQRYSHLSDDRVRSSNGVLDEVFR